MTAQEIIDEAKVPLRINGSELDAMLLSRLNRQYRTYARRDNWPQMLVVGQTLTTAANTSEYLLPANFKQFAEDFLYYDVTATAGGYTYGGPMVSILPVGSTPMNGTLAAYQGAGVVGFPGVASIAPSTSDPSRMALLFHPALNDANKMLLFSYYRMPDDLASDTEIEITPLLETLVSATCKSIAIYHGEEQAATAAFYAEEERNNYRIARRTLL